ncbi:MAG: hypothetical protein U9N81_12480, partial [Bacillota bacterium]|nr:hypothetical protein [Bacillota bacterium]
ESLTSTIGHINLDAKRLGKRSAGKPHAAFDVAGVGNGKMTRLRGTLTRKGRNGKASQGLHFTAPALDPTLARKLI